MSSQSDFISSIAEAALVASAESGLSFELMLSQAALETGWGEKVLPDTNNIFNIKADPSWTGDTKTVTVSEYINGKWVTQDSQFKVYPTVEDGLKDRVKFLQGQRGQHRVKGVSIALVFEQPCHVAYALN